MNTFFESLAIFFLKTNTVIKKAFGSIINAVNSQQIQIFFTVIILFLTSLLVLAWNNLSILGRFALAIVYGFILLFTFSTLYFFVKKKRFHQIGNKWEVLDNFEVRHDFNNLKTIPLNEVAIRNLYMLFSEKHLEGSFQTFVQLLELGKIDRSERLEWSDKNPNNPKQINRQTLLEFLSQILTGFENLTNKSIADFCDYYFIIRGQSDKAVKITSKNVSDWRTNRSPYLLGVSKLVSRAING